MNSDARHVSLVIELLRTHEINEFEVSDGTSHFKILLPADRSLSSDSAVGNSNNVKSSLDVEVLSPGTGTFVARHPSRSTDLATVGERKREGDFVALIQTGSIFRPVLAPCAGEIVKRHCRTGDQVDFRFPLFTIRREAESRLIGDME